MRFVIGRLWVQVLSPAPEVKKGGKTCASLKVSKSSAKIGKEKPQGN